MATKFLHLYLHIHNLTKTLFYIYIYILHNRQTHIKMPDHLNCSILKMQIFAILAVFCNANSIFFITKTTHNIIKVIYEIKFIYLPFIL